MPPIFTESYGRGKAKGKHIQKVSAFDIKMALAVYHRSEEMSYYKENKTISNLYLLYEKMVESRNSCSQPFEISYGSLLQCP